MASLPDRDAAPRMPDYAAARAHFHVAVPLRFNAVRDIVERFAAEAPDALALLTIAGDGGEIGRHTAADLAQLARQAARMFLALGIGRADRVLIMLPRSVAWYAAMLGAMRIGAVPMPAPNLLTTKDIAFRIDRGRAVAAVANTSGADKIDAIGLAAGPLRHRLCVCDHGNRPGWLNFGALLTDAASGELPPDPTAAHDPLLIYFTSGTVGPPKMVEHDQAYALGHVATARFWHDLRAGDRHWTASDTGWAKAAWGGLFGQWHERAAVVQVDVGKPDAEQLLSIIARHGITSFCAPPTLYRQLIRADFAAHDLSRLRHCTSAGEPLNPEVIRAWRQATGLTIHDGFGQTESTVLVANFRCNPVRPGSMGKPVPGYDVAILDDVGSAVPVGATGNVAVRSDPHPVGLFRGYAGDPVATAQRFRAGFYYTGDRAMRDADGYLWFEGREDDVITSSAYRIGPFEVESAMIEHPAVMEAGVVGRPDPHRTEVVCGFVRLAPGYRATTALTLAIQAHVRAVTAPYKYPREIIYVRELPKTISGKIRRAVLRDWLREAVPEAALLPVQNDDEPAAVSIGGAE